MSSPQVLAPDFFIVGAAKAGTTSLFHYLNQHKDLFLSTKDKESGYFCDLWGTNDTAYYNSLFSDAEPTQLRGDASTPYLTCPASPSLIHAANPDAKIIILLRNPKARAFSLYKQMVKQGHETRKPFKRALDSEAKRLEYSIEEQKKVPGYHYNYLYMDSGKYRPQLERYFDTFPAEQIKVLIFEEFIKAPKETVSEVLEFLNVDPDFTFEPEVHNPSQYPRSLKLQNLLKRHVEDRARENGAYRMVQLAQMLKGLNLRLGKVPKLRDEEKQILTEQLSESIDATRDFLKMDLPSWG